MLSALPGSGHHNKHETTRLRISANEWFLPLYAAGQQVLATKEKESDGNRQFEITEQYLLDFIAKNKRLSDMLHALRGC